VIRQRGLIIRLSVRRSGLVAFYGQTKRSTAYEVDAGGDETLITRACAGRYRLFRETAPISRTPKLKTCQESSAAWAGYCLVRPRATRFPRRLHRGLLDIRQEQILIVAVLGRFKAAKSSFLNHPLGRRTMMRCEECDRPVRSLFVAYKTGEASPE